MRQNKKQMPRIFSAGDVEQVFVDLCKSGCVLRGGFCEANLARKTTFTNYQHILMSAAGSCENYVFEERSPLGLAWGGLWGSRNAHEFERMHLLNNLNKYC